MYKAGGKPNGDFYIRNIAHSLRYLNEQKLAEYKITNQQARLLGAIRRSLFDGANISRKFLQERMELSGPSVTSLLNGLEKNGFITRYPAKDDGRAMQIAVTEKGEKIMAALDRVFQDTEQRLLAGMTEEEKAVFITLLARAYANMS
jgi:MarR family transcriptional repressor of mepA